MVDRHKIDFIAFTVLLVVLFFLFFLPIDEQSVLDCVHQTGWSENRCLHELSR